MCPTPLHLDKLNCSIIEVGGKDSLPLMIRVVAALGKPLLVFYDTDSRLEGNDAARNAAKNERIETACAEADATAHSFDPFLEEEVGIEGNSKAHKDRRMREYLLGLASWDDVPPPLTAMLELVAAQAGKGH